MGQLSHATEAQQAHMPDSCQMAANLHWKCSERIQLSHQTTNSKKKK
jgi:hypothetical protein